MWGFPSGCVPPTGSRTKLSGKERQRKRQGEEIEGAGAGGGSGEERNRKNPMQLLIPAEMDKCF